MTRNQQERKYSITTIICFDEDLLAVCSNHSKCTCMYPVARGVLDSVPLYICVAQQFPQLFMGDIYMK